MIKNITIVSCHSRVGGNLDTCFRKVNTKFVSPNSIGFTIVAGLVNNQSIAPFVFNGTCNTELFNNWVEKFLIKELKAGQVVVMDNASFHKSKKTKELIESVGCKLIFLPPYSPDLNPIEKFWANMKRWIKNKVTETSKLFEIIAMFFVT